MPRLITVFFLLFFSRLILSADNKIPRVPSEMIVAGMKLKITEAARRDIQKDVNALRSHPQYFKIKLDRAKLYFPIIEKIFKKEGIPDDFKFLAIQESALISDAVSSANAVGFWQFKHFTGREVGLKIDKNVDERLNIVSSTYGVSKYFRRHNFYFKNWMYSILAHMTGRGGAMKYVDKSRFGVKKMTINRNTHWYIKRFLAHLIAFKKELKGSHSEGLNLLIYEKGKGKNLENIAKNFKVDYKELKKYNKWLKRGKVPSEKQYAVLIPTTRKIKISPFQNTTKNEELVVGNKTYPNIEQLLNISNTIFIKINGIQSILAKHGNTADSLAEKGKISLTKFLKYNDMTSSDIIKEGEIYYLKKKRRKANIYFYTVKKMESMWSISQKFGIKVKNLAKLNRMLIMDKLEPGRLMWLRKKRPKDIPVEIKKNQNQHIQTEEEVQSDFQEASKLLYEEENNELGESYKELFEPATINEKNIKKSSNTHLVRKGDTLYEISKKYNVSINDIKKWNNLNSNVLKLGKQLIINQKQFPNIIKKDESIVAPKVINKTYIVKAGETLYGISKKYGVSVDSILNRNGLTSINLNTGQQLIIPKQKELLKKKIVQHQKLQTTQITFHVVKTGDTFYSISQKYNIGVKKLLELNNKNNTNLNIGEKIRVIE